MDQQTPQPGIPVVEKQENALLGALGAFLFALLGGVIYVVLYQLDILAAISTFISVVCAIKGYAVFSGKESKRGITIAIIMAALVIILAWYICFCIVIYEQFQADFQSGTLDQPVSLLRCLSLGLYYLPNVPSYFLQLLWSAIFGGLCCFGYVANRSKREEAIAAQQQAQARTKMLAEQQAAQAAEDAAKEDAYRDPADDPIAKAKAFYESVGNDDAEDTAGSAAGSDEDSDTYRDEDSENA